MPRPAITRVPNLAITPVSTNKNNGLYAPQLTQTQINAIPAATLANGAIVYNTALGTLQSYVDGVWNNLNSSLATASGVGLVAGTPFILPSGTRVAVEVPANQINGFMYYDTTNTVARAYIAGGWVTVTTA